jgi:hypothetical protein
MTTTINKFTLSAGAAVVLLLSFAAVVFTMTAFAAETPTITPTVQNGSNANITSALIGTLVHGSVTVASSTASTSPTGTVDFTMYNGTGCPNTGTVQALVPLVNGAASSSVTTLNAGGLSYRVHYNGQGDLYNPGDSACASVAANTFTPSVSTTLSSTSITAGEFVNDAVTLSNATSTAGGSVAFKVYSDNVCSNLALNAGSKTVTNTVVPNSDSWQFITPGTYYWQVVYSGDANNSPATSTCSSEVLTVSPAQLVKASPTITTTLSTTTALIGTSVFDSAVFVNGTTTSGGVVTYKIFSNNSCTSLYQNAGTKTVTNGVIPNSDSVVLNTAGTYYWQVSYPGDAFTNPATSTCTNEVVTINATGTTPPTGGAGTISGTVYNDVNKNDVKDAGDNGLSGWKVWLHKAATTTNKSGKIKGSNDLYNAPIIMTATTDANGNYSFANLGAGTYFVEEEEQSGWDQTSDDAKVVLADANSSGQVNFANVQKGVSDGDNEDNDNNSNHDKDNPGKHKGWEVLKAKFIGWWRHSHQ